MIKSRNVLGFRFFRAKVIQSVTLFLSANAFAANPMSGELDRNLASPATTQNSAMASPRGLQKSAKSPSDQQRATIMTNQLRAQNYDLSRIQVSSSDGHVILSGLVHSRAEADALLQSARLANGGAGVISNIQIDHTPR